MVAIDRPQDIAESIFPAGAVLLDHEADVVDAEGGAKRGTLSSVKGGTGTHRREPQFHVHGARIAFGEAPAPGTSGAKITPSMTFAKAAGEIARKTARVADGLELKRI